MNKNNRLNLSENLFSKKSVYESSINKYKNSDGDDIKLKPQLDENYKKGKLIDNKKEQGKIFTEDRRKISDDRNEEDVSEYASQVFYDGLKEHDLCPVFGEKIEEQTRRLKTHSPFGNCKSWKLFKFIVKSGEDLRQEQFATQLINEFNQIFRLENVDMWLKPYEILSTGHNVGVIECVPNAVSLDYLKRKAKGFTTLRRYFEQYFGDTNKESKI